ncbi:MAG: radical SAM protein, partial [Archaeoglobaceae archaeon]
INELEAKISMLEKECKKHGIEFSTPNLKEFVVQTILARGNEEVSDLLLGRNYRDFLEFLKPLSLESPLPWDFINHGYKKSKLQLEFTKLMERLDKSYKPSEV